MARRGPVRPSCNIHTPGGLAGQDTAYAGHLTQDEIKELYHAMCEAMGRAPDIRHNKIVWQWVLGYAMGWAGFLSSLAVVALVIFD